jgi:hypothetical protein
MRIATGKPEPLVVKKAMKEQAETEADSLERRRGRPGARDLARRAAPFC